MKILHTLLADDELLLQVKVNVFLTEMSNFEIMNAAYAEFFNKGVRPLSNDTALSPLILSRTRHS